MKKLLTKWLTWRVYWSNLRHKNDVNDCDVVEEVKDEFFLADVRIIINNIYSKFKYTYDKPTELFDAMHKPAQCYKNYLDGLLKDDCDGYHSALYHALSCNKYKCALLTYMVPDITQCHTTLVVLLKNRYFHIDYKAVQRYVSFDDLINHVHTKHPDIFAYNLVRYDYDKKKFYIVEEI